jgi:hypothetical protein
MASLDIVGKAEALSLALERAFNVEPSIEYGSNYARIYYQPDRLKKVQAIIYKMANDREPGSIRVDWFPIITPIALQKGVPYIIGLVGLGYLLGKL